MLWRVAAFLCLLDTISSQGGRNYRPAPTREPPSREIPGQGVVVGKEIMIYRSKSLAFLGVPFAEPPVGRLRFAAPVTPPKPWSGIRNANKFAPACMQIPKQFQEQDRLLLRLVPEIEYSEDCLYLNIFLPDGSPPSEGWPVMLWFHPGNLSVGATSLWDGSAIAMGQKIIVVTTAYRLNIFGFFTTMDHMAPGNAGLLDQVAALDWVRDKIASFGGSPRNIVLCGHSGGGASIGLHLVSPHSQGKFSRAIIMSARGLISRTVRPPSQVSEAMRAVADKFLCDLPSNLLLDCLRRQSPEYLLQNSALYLASFGPIIDLNYVRGTLAFLPDDPVQLVASSQFARVPILAGYTDMEDALQLLETNDNAQRGVSWDEYNMAVAESVGEDIDSLDPNDTCILELASSHLYDSALFYYTPRPLILDSTVFRERLVALMTEKYYGSGAYLLASALAQTNTPTYIYRFDYKIKTDHFIRFPRNETHLPAWVSAAHQFDLPFTWGMPYWTNLMKNLTWNSADKKMTDTILILWGNFVKYGNPTHSGINLKWDVFRENTSGVMILDRNSNMSDVLNLDYKAFEFWNNYYPKVYNVLLRSCNMSNAGETIYKLEHYRASSMVLMLSMSFMNALFFIIR